MKIAFVHDYLIQYGGAERVLEAFCEIWPQAPIYTLLHDSKLVHHRFDKQVVRTSYLQKLPFTKRHHRIFPFFMMTAIEQFNLGYYDVVLSDSSSFAKNIVTSPKTLHICYCHTPMRYSWDDCQYYTQEFSFPRWVRRITPFLMNYIRVSDYFSTNGVDVFLANSKFVSSRIKKYYKRDSEIINPPVQVDKFYTVSKEEVSDYFLMVGRMMKYKRMDLVIEAFNKLKLPLKIVGRGMEEKRLKKLAGPTIEFAGRIPDKNLYEIYSKARAFIFPQEEDFGIVAIEALASGRPLIALRAGDIPEHVTENKSAVFFENQTKEEIIQAVQRFQQLDSESAFDPEWIRSTALKFDEEIFKSKIKNKIEKEWEKFKESKEFKGSKIIKKKLKVRNF